MTHNPPFNAKHLPRCPPPPAGAPVRPQTSSCRRARSVSQREEPRGVGVVLFCFAQLSNASTSLKGGRPARRGAEAAERRGRRTSHSRQRPSGRPEAEASGKIFRVLRNETVQKDAQTRLGQEAVCVVIARAASGPGGRGPSRAPGWVGERGCSALSAQTRAGAASASHHERNARSPRPLTFIVARLCIYTFLPF